MKLFTPLIPLADAAEAVRAMVLLGSAVFVVSLGYGAGLPLLQLYLAQYLGSAEPQRIAWHVGMLGGIYTFALFLFAPWWGRLSDRCGRTVVLMAGFAAFLVGSAVAALASNLGVVYAARLLAGAGAAAIVPTAQAYIADISTAVYRNRRFVLLGSTSFLGFLAGPAFGTWLAGPVMGVSAGQMPSMVNWPALLIAVGGIPILLLTPWSLGSNAGAKTSLGDVLNHFHSTDKGKSGILMGVHLVEFLEVAGGLAIPSLSNSIRMSKYNLLELHS